MEEKEKEKERKERDAYLRKELLGWLGYSVLFSLLLVAYTGISLKTVSGGIILGFFAGILNDIRPRR